MLSLFFIGSFVLIVLDQISKYFAYNTLRLSGGISLIDGVFQLNYCENRGAAFGILQNQLWLFIPLTIIIIGAVIFFMVKNKPESKLLIASLTLLTGGALGNFIDRIFRGYVIDFLDFCLIDFPVFNVADCFVVVGAFFLALYILFFSPDFPKNEKEKKPSNNNSEEEILVEISGIAPDIKASENKKTEKE